MRTRRILAALLCLGVMAVSIGGCAGKKEETPKDTQAVAESSTEEKETAVKKTDFPKKNIKIIVPYAAGGGVDITTRILADTAGKDYFNGNSIIVENMPGGGAVIGATSVANAEPDGYTLLAYSNSIVSAPLLKEVTFTLDSFKPLGMVCFDSEIFVVPPTSPYKTWEEFVAYAKENTVKLATPGHSTAHHIAAMQLAKEFGLKFEYLHNDSASIQMQQLMGGHCDAAMMAAGEAVSAIKDGTVIGLAIGTEKRMEEIPDVPTFKEMGGTMVAGAFRGYACPAGVPDDVYQVLCDEFSKITTSEKFISSMKEASVPYSYKNAADFKDYTVQYYKDIEALVPELKETK